MPKPKTQLFVILPNIRNQEKQIIEDIKNNYEIVDIYDIEWSKKYFYSNLARLYQYKYSRKNKDVPYGNILLIIAKSNSENETYLAIRKKYAKNKIYSIFTADTPRAVDCTLTLLLGKNYSDFIKDNQNKSYDNVYKKIKQDVIGAANWNNINDFLYTINNCCSYVFVRNYGELTSKNPKIKTPTILVDNIEKFECIANIKHQKKSPYSYIIINNEKIELKIIYYGDDSYPFIWQEQMINSRVLDNGMYTLTDENYFYALIYHVLVHKFKLSAKYLDILQNYFYKLDLDKTNNLKDYKSPYDLYHKLLHEFMHKNSYRYVKPINKLLKYNNYHIEKAKIAFKLLTKYNFNRIESIFIDKKPTSGFTHFFKAYTHENAKVFIKCGGTEETAKKEYMVMEILHKQNPKYFPKPYSYSETQNEKYIAMEYIEGKTLSETIKSKDSTQSQKQNAFDSLYNIARILSSNNYIHRDINLNNLIVQEDGTIVLIDFQHLIGNDFPELQIHLKEPKRLRGLNRKNRPQPFTWDDMYSFHKIMKEFKSHNIQGFNDKIKDIKSQIGKKRIHFLENKFEVKAYFNYNMFFAYKLYGLIQIPFYKIKHK